MLNNDKKVSKKVLHAVFLIDITGSMGSQIEAVKQMVAEFCAVDRPGIQVHIYTFTEDRNNCYVSKSPADLAGRGLVDYVNKISLCCPPDLPGVNASGEDGPENVVAAMAALLADFDGSDNLLTFVITDSDPHYKALGHSATAVKEREWLQGRGFTETDIFKILNEVVESLNITIVPVLFQGAIASVWYQQAAVLTDGLLLCPQSADAKLMANGLGAILDMMQTMSYRGTVGPDDASALARRCTGFSILNIDADTFEILESDPPRQLELQRRYPQVTEIESALMGLLQTTKDRFSGKRSGKRCRSVDPAVVAASVRFLVSCMLKISNSRLDESAKKLQTAFEDLQKAIEESALVEDKKYEIKLLNKVLESLNAMNVNLGTAVARDLQPVECAIMLESSLDYLKNLEQVPRSEDDVKSWMEMALRLTMCRLLQVEFPLDIFGKQDFKDAWAARIKGVSYATVLSTNAAVLLRDLDSGMYKDPLTREEFTAALLLAHPNDPVLSVVFRVLSALPSLQGLVQSYLVSGGLKVFPSIVAGLQSATLTFVLRHIKDQPTQAQWETIRCILWSLRCSIDPPARDIAKRIASNEGFNPEDHTGKLGCGILRFLQGHMIDQVQEEKLLMAYWEEVSGETVVAMIRNRNRGQTYAFEDIAEFFVPTAANFDPVTESHPIEKILAGKQEPLPSGMEKLRAFVEESEEFKRTWKWFSWYCRLIHADLKMTSVDAALESIKFDIERNKSDAVRLFAEAVLLERRVARYDLDSETKVWTRRPGVPDWNQRIRDQMAKRYQSDLSQWSSQRLEKSHQVLMERVSSMSITDPDQLLKHLKDNRVELLGNVYRLKRSDVPTILEQIKDAIRLKVMAPVLITAPWTSEPPSDLRRHVSQIKTLLNEALSPDELGTIVSEISKAQVCAREKGSNRHGHTKTLNFPGMLGWSEDYAKARGERYQPQLQKMKAYTEYYQDLKKRELNEVKRLMALDFVEKAADNLPLDRVKPIVDSIVKSAALEDTKYAAEVKEVCNNTYFKGRSRIRPIDRITAFLQKLTE